MSATVTPLVVRRSLGWSIGVSVFLILAGTLTIIVPPVAGLAVNIFVAWMLLFSAGGHLVYAWHNRMESGIWWEVLIGVLFAVVGIFLLLNPVVGLLSLTLALAIYLFVQALMEIFLSFQLRPLPGTGWLLFDGVLTLVLGLMIWRTWPWSTEWAIGILLGISMLFSGVSRLLLSLAARRRLA